ncbi:MAG: saccharopine dehydrogenase NADP-binding domain-containing protein [Steroidobacteraceae bacterium]
MDLKAVAVYGATGHTGAFVLRELERRGLRTVSIGRNGASLSETGQPDAPRREWRRASCDDPDALDEALRGTGAVVNCAGPFLDTASALIEAALRTGIHYFDITAEQRSVRLSLATYHEEARARGIVVLPAMAFFGGLADLLAAEVTRGTSSIECIEIGVALDYWHPTEGTRKTGDRNTARRLVIAGGRLAPVPKPAPVRDWTFPEPFGLQEVVAVPLSEIVTISRHIAVRNVCSYMNSAPLRDLNDPRTPPPTKTDPLGRSSQRFVMDVHATAGGDRRRIAVAGRDIYAITAPIVVEACMRILSDPPAAGGAYAPAELFDAKSFISALVPHLRVVRSLYAASSRGRSNRPELSL